MHVMEYIVSTEREDAISAAYDQAEQQIDEALEAGTITVNDATTAAVDAATGLKAIEINDIEGTRIRIEGPLTGDSIWSVTHDGLSTTVALARGYTAAEIHDHDTAALEALEKWLAGI